MNRKTVKSEVLPEGWQEVRLGEVCFIDKEMLSSKTSHDYCFQYISLSDIRAGQLLQTSEHVFSKAPSRARRVVKRGDVLLATVRPNLEGFYIFRGRVKDHIVSTGFAVLTPKPKLLDSGYIFQYLFSKHMLSAYKAFNVGSNYPALNSSDVCNFTISIPSLSQQKAITSLLEKWDAAIEKTEALIVAKEQQFKWLLKTLINDQQNNPDWRKVKLRDICKISKGIQLNKLHMIKTGEYPVLNGGMKLSGYTSVWNTPANTITISEGGNSCGYVNFNTRDFWAGGHCYTLTNLRNELRLSFLYHQLKGREQLIMRLRVGSGLPNIQKGDIENFPCSLPPLPEQKTIANMLNKAQREIDLLKQFT